MSSLELIMTKKVELNQEAVDCAWANCLASLLVEIINYSFQKTPRDLLTWLALRGRLDHWELTKPTGLNLSHTTRETGRLQRVAFSRRSGYPPTLMLLHGFITTRQHYC